jgi:hypothetical protein
MARAGKCFWCFLAAVVFMLAAAAPGVAATKKVRVSVPSCT